MAHISKFHYEEKRNSDGSLFGSTFAIDIALEEGEIPYPLTEVPEKYDQKVLDNGKMLIGYVKKSLDHAHEVGKPPVKMISSPPVKDGSGVDPMAGRGSSTSSHVPDRSASSGHVKYPKPTPPMLKKINAIDKMGDPYSQHITDFLRHFNCNLETITGDDANILIDELEKMKTDRGE